MAAEPIQTERLLLRALTPDDAEAVWAVWGDPEVAKYLADPVYPSPEALRGLFEPGAEGENHAFAAVEKATGELIGTCGVGPEGNGAEWGFDYCLRRDRWGRGFATEMAKALLAFARGRGARAFVAECAQENPASARVMEKCGMVRTAESRFRKSGTDLVYPSYLYRLHLE